MTTDSRVIRAEPHAEIGNLLERDAETIVELWCMRAAEEQAAAKRVHHDVLRDDFPRFLREVAKALRASSDTEVRPHERNAVRHGMQRWESGWSLSEVVRDYQILQLVLLDYLEQMLTRPLRLREMMAVGVFIDDAIAASIASYSAGRDEAALKAERERAAALEEISRRKDEFLAMLGHELRNPLAPILTAVKIIQSLSPTGPQPLLSAVEVIERQSKHLVRLVDDTLDLVRIERGRFELRKERLDMSAALHQALEAVEPMLKSRDQQLSAALPSVPLYVDADSNRLVQIVANLLNNASKYTAPGGHIWLSAEGENGEAVIRVRDNGVGIPQDMLARVFDLFTQVESSRENAEGGMGIGLTLVRLLTEQHGGKVSCKSPGVGHGSEFTVRLPLSGRVSDAGTLTISDDTHASPDEGMLRVQVVPKPKLDK
jgi:signal transduction histidine kinase